MILTLSLLAHCSAAGMGSTLESHGDTETTLFDAFKEDIQSMINDYTNLEIIEQLKAKGFHTSLTALKHQLQDWGFRRQSGGNGP